MYSSTCNKPESENLWVITKSHETEHSYDGNRKFGGRLNVQADTANGSALDSGINRLVPQSMVSMPSRPQYGRLMRIKAT